MATRSKMTEAILGIKRHLRAQALLKDKKEFVVQGEPRPEEAAALRATADLALARDLKRCVCGSLPKKGHSFKACRQAALALLK